MNKDKLIELISNAWDDGNGNSYPSQTREDTNIGLQNFLDSCEKEIKELSEPNADINTTDANLNIGCVNQRFIDTIDTITSEGLGCGLEDCNITDRYEAMQYGFDECLERAKEAISNVG